MKRYLWLLMVMLLLITSCVVPIDNTASGAPEMVLSKEETMSVHFIDVGQADCILIESDEEFMLIDAGNNADGALVLSYLEEEGVETLSYVIGTHPHEDHIGSLDEVIDHFQAEVVIMPGVSHNTESYEDVLSAILTKGLKITAPEVGEEYTLGSAYFTILAPNGDYSDDLNSWSVGIRLVYGDTAFVFAGDAEAKAEQDMCSNGLSLKADVLKLSHHGSQTSSDELFLEAVDPEYGVISCETGNDYGHPHKETLEKLRRYGIALYRTDEQGTIVVNSDGKSLSFSSPPAAESVSSAQSADFILNTSTNKFHRQDCKRAESIKTENYQEYHGARDDLIQQGYGACGSCKP